MRLWHKDLIPYLPQKQLQGQWKELFQIKGSIEKHGTPRHILVNKVLDFPISHFIAYGIIIFNEGQRRGIKFKKSKLMELTLWKNDNFTNYDNCSTLYETWHNDRYLDQCYYNHQEKYDCDGIDVNIWERFEQNYLLIKEDKYA